MAEPKKRTSKSRKNKRRVNHHSKAIQLVVCKKCGKKIEHHTVCKSCGEYNK